MGDELSLSIEEFDEGFMKMVGATEKLGFPPSVYCIMLVAQALGAVTLYMDQVEALKTMTPEDFAAHPGVQALMADYTGLDDSKPGIIDGIFKFMFG